MTHATLDDQKNGLPRSPAARMRGTAPGPTVANSNALNDRLLTFQIDKRSRLPIYLQISNFILDLLEKTPFLPGTLLPAERIVCDCLGISKMTLRQAFSVLIQKGRDAWKLSAVSAPSFLVREWRKRFPACLVSVKR